LVSRFPIAAKLSEHFATNNEAHILGRFGACSSNFPLFEPSGLEFKSNESLAASNGCAACGIPANSEALDMTQIWGRKYL
jgi:hypothetical protein